MIFNSFFIQLFPLMHIQKYSQIDEYTLLLSFTESFLLSYIIMFDQQNQGQSLTIEKQEIHQNLPKNQLDASNISDKIEMVRQSIAQFSIVSKGINMQSLRRLQAEQENNASFVEEEQRKILSQLTALEQSIDQIQRERMLQCAQLCNSFQGIEFSMQNAEEDSKDANKRNHDKFQEHRDQIMNLKIQLAEIEVNSKEKIGRFDRESQIRIINSKKDIQIYDQYCKNSRFQRNFKALKEIRNSIEQEQKLQQRQLKRITAELAELKQVIVRRVGEQQRRQKEGFRQNYKALQQFVLFLSEQYGVQR